MADTRDFRASFERLEKKIRKTTELVQISVNVEQVSLSFLGAQARCEPLRPRIIDELPRFDLRHLDELEDSAGATAYAQALFRASLAPNRDLTELAAEAAEVIETLEDSAKPLAKAGYVDLGEFTRLTTRPPGKATHASRVFSLIGLVTLFRKDWKKIENMTHLTEAQLAEYEKLAADLGRATGAVKAGDAQEHDAEGAAVSLLRKQSYTLLYWNVFQVRRAVLYLRALERDADAFIPSLFAGRGGNGGGGGGGEGGGGEGGGGVGGGAEGGGDSGPRDPNVGGIQDPKPTAPVIRPGYPGSPALEPETPENK